MKRQEKIQSLQAVRALAFLGVFTCHAGLNQLGAWGASVFLMLSGFLLVYTYYEKAPELTPKAVWAFATKKIQKIYPLHLLMMLAAVPFAIRGLVSAFSGYALTRFAGQVVLNVFLLQSWVPKSAAYFSLNGVAWYLSICAFLYVTFPYLLKLVKGYKRKFTPYINIVVVLCVQFGIAFLMRNVSVPMSVCDNPAKWVTYIFPLFRLGDFWVGCNLGYLFLRRERKQGSFVATACEAAVFCLLVVSQMIYNGQYGFFSTEWFKLTVMYVPTSALLIYFFACNEGWISRLLTNRVFIYIGNISGYAFLIHQIVIRYLWELRAKFLGQQFQNWMVAITAFVVTLLLVELYKKAELLWQKK